MFRKHTCSLKLCILMCLILMISMMMQIPAGASETAVTLRVAYYPLEGFFEYDESGNEVGYGVELLDAISRYTGIQFAYVPAESWESTKQMLLDGEADIRMPGTMPAQPSTTLEYTNSSVIDTYYAIMTLKSREDLYYEDYETFQTLRYGISENLYNTLISTYDFASLNIRKDQLTFYAEYNDCREALVRGEIDAVISNIMDLDDEMKKLKRFSTVSNYISMRIGDPEIERLDEGLSNLKQSEPTFMADLYKEWFPKRIEVPLTKEETEFLAQLGGIRFLFQDEQGYLSRKDEQGKYVGYYPEIAQQVCDELGVECIPATEADKKQGILVYPGFYYDYTWAEKCGVDLSLPYDTAFFNRVIRKDQNVNHENARVAVYKDLQIEDSLLDDLYTKDQMVECNSFMDCINAVKDGRADVTYVNRYTSEYYMNSYRFGGLSASLSDISYQESFGVSGDESGMLASILGKKLMMIATPDLLSIMREFRSQKIEQNVILEYLYGNPLKSAVIISVIITLFIVMIILLWVARRMQQNSLALKEATEAKQDFISRISHDMRTPMNAIIGFAEFGGESRSPDEMKKYYEKISAAGKYLLQLINDSLDLTKIGSANYELHPEPCTNREFIDEIENLFSEKARKDGVKFTVHYDTEELVCLEFDKLRLQQIFVNLLNNAVKFTPEGGHVSLEISHENASEGTVLVHFKVSDDGIGMSEEFQKKMYQPFEQEQRGQKGQGTGLGLAIVSKLIETMGGTIRCESKVGSGTTFFVDLCMKKAILKETAVKAGVTEIHYLKGKRALLCEDNELNREVANLFLEKEGMHVTNAEDGQQGVEYFSHSEEYYFDVILMDVRMPVMDGIEATKAIRGMARKDAATVPIIALSANTFDEDIEECKAAGMNGHMSKPIIPDEFYKVLQKAIPSP